MKPRDRVMRAFRKLDGNPDRVPVQFDLCKEHLHYFSRKLNIPLEITNNLYEDVTYRISGNEIRIAMGCDVVVTGSSTADDFNIIKESEGTWLNEYGMKMKEGEIHVEIVDYPLKNIETINDVKDFSLPNPKSTGRFKDLERLVKKYHDDYAVIGDLEVTIFALARQLVGMEKYFIDMAIGEEYIQPLLEKCTDFQIEMGLEMIERGVDAIWTGDDFGSQNSLLFSRAMFLDIYKHHYQRMIKRFKEKNPEIIMIHHSCGAVRDLLDDIIEIGYDVFNPVQPGVPGHGPKELKDRFGNKIVFFGGIDQQDLLPNGTDEELENDIIEKIEILGKDRGYMIAPAHIIQRDVSPERVEKFIELAYQHGQY